MSLSHKKSTAQALLLLFIILTIGGIVYFGVKIQKSSQQEVSERNNEQTSVSPTTSSSFESNNSMPTVPINTDDNQVPKPTKLPQKVAQASVEILNNCSPYSFATYQEAVYSREGYENPGFFTLLGGANPDTFMVLGECKGSDVYATDNRNLYYKSQYYNAAEKIEDADPLTFALLDSKFLSQLAHDKDALYYRGDKLDCSDGSSLQEIKNSYYRDDSNVYRYLANIETDELLSLCADPTSFEILSGGFSRDKDNLFFATNATWSNDTSAKIEGGDPQSFVDLPSLYAKDKNHVYVVTRPYEGLPSASILSDADPTTFTVLDDGVGLARDMDTIFLSAKVLEQARPSSFRVLTPLNEKDNLLDGVYAVDDSVAYFFEGYEVPSSPKQKIIRDADIDTLTNLDGIYAKDSDSVYIRGKKIEDANPTAFSSLGYGFAHDGSRVYGSSFNTYDFGFEFQVSCSSCNLSSFVVLNREYARDSSNVYYYDSRNRKFTPIKQADADTFQVSDTEDIHKEIDAQDKNHSYKDGEIAP